MGECRKTPGEYECAVLNATVRRMVLGRVVIATVSAVVFAACSGGHSSVSSADAQSLADIRTLDAGAWRDLRRLDYADPVITRQCGHKDTNRVFHHLDFGLGLIVLKRVLFCQRRYTQPQMLASKVSGFPPKLHPGIEEF